MSGIFKCLLLLSLLAIKLMEQINVICLLYNFDGKNIISKM